MKKLNVLFIILLFSICLKAQTTLTLQPDSATGKDAYLRSLTPDQNYGTHPDFNSEACTNGGNFVAVRSVIDFDLSSIPSTAVITDAKLYLYTYNSPSTGQHTGDNMSLLQRITSSWDDMTVTWNTSPTTTTMHQDTLPTSTDVNENYIVDVTTLVQDYVADKANSFGFMLRLADETVQKKMIFGSSNNPDSTLHPKLEVCYHLNQAGIAENNLNDINLKIFPNPTVSNVNISYNLKESCMVNFEIFDITGKLILNKNIGFQNKGINTNTLNLGNNLVKGMYFLKINYGIHSEFIKLLKN